MAKDTKAAESDADILSEAKRVFQQCEDAESVNRQSALDDINFALLSEQWDARDIEKRHSEGRPCLTINKLDPLIRQVVNDARQNKPSIKVHPADSGADVETAEIYDGLIRNIEYTSSADIAYDTATEQAVAGGFGYFRVGLEYAFDDVFDLDIRIERIANQFSVYGDPMSTAADSSDWNVAFIIDRLTKDEFQRVYGKSEAVDWDGDAYRSDSAGDGTWFDGDMVQLAEYWTREEYEKEIALLSDGSVIDAATIKDDMVAVMMAAEGLTVKQTRKARCHRVMQRIMTGADILSTRKWPGKYIPIIPVYGREINVKGKRYLKSLIHDAKDSQRMFNYWRTASTELVALAPKAPFIGKKGAFKTDVEKWATANRTSHAFVEYDGDERPARQPFDGPPAAALQEALNASDDIKSSTGIYDASLGARSNETSGKAIMARQREGDVSTFHFQDNMVRAIRHNGRILIDLIPKVYTKDRMIRILGEDQKPRTLPLGQPTPVIGRNGQPMPAQSQQPGQQPPQPQAPGEGGTASEIMMKVFDLGVGKYDLTVTTGPSFTTRREEAAEQMTAMVQAFPMAAPVIIPKLAKNLDWPGADDIADELEALAPKPQGGIPPQIQQAMQQSQQQIQMLTQQVQQLEADKQINLMKAQTDQFNAQTNRMKAQAEIEAKAYELARPQPAPQNQGTPN
jgi:hypothetical protein